jgi:2'-5' RNA ligase
VRAFLAVPVRPPAHERIGALLDALRGRVAGVRWVDAATPHVTLHFFAELPDVQVGAVVDAVARAIAGSVAFPLRPARLGSFPAGARPRVLWLGLEAEAALDELAARVQGAVGGCGFETDPRPFRPHVTLGRPGRRFDSRAWHDELETQLSLPGFMADRVVLFESRDGHHVREVLPLRGAVSAATS